MSEKRRTKNRITPRKLLTAKLPSAIMDRISPLLGFGLAALIFTLVILTIPSVRRSAPLFAALGVVVTAYSLWQKADVLKRGYDEYLFKVIDYSYMAPLVTKRTMPTGLVLIKKDEDDSAANIYHIAVSGSRKLLPPLDWIIRVYVPKGMEAAVYGDKKYFPVVYGYRIEGEDR